MTTPEHCWWILKPQRIVIGIELILTSSQELSIIPSQTIPAQPRVMVLFIYCFVRKESSLKCSYVLVFFLYVKPLIWLCLTPSVFLFFVFFSHLYEVQRTFMHTRVSFTDLGIYRRQKQQRTPFERLFLTNTTANVASAISCQAWSPLAT